jgi:hypothetical protein
MRGRDTWQAEEDWTLALGPEGNTELGPKRQHQTGFGQLGSSLHRFGADRTLSSDPVWRCGRMLVRESIYGVQREGSDVALGGGPDPDCSESDLLGRTGSRGFLPSLDLSASDQTLGCAGSGGHGRAESGPEETCGVNSTVGDERLALKGRDTWH